jgi:methionyl-tRNA synthetase
MAPKFQQMVEALNCTNDDFIRTSEPRHYETVTELWKRMAANGDIYLDKYAGWYSVRDEAFYGEDELEDRDGQKFSIKTGTPVEWVEEESYFFKLSAYQDKLLKLYDDQPDFIGPRRAQERSRQLRQGRAEGPCPCLAPRSTGASLCQMRRVTSCMCGWMR